MVAQPGIQLFDQYYSSEIASGSEAFQVCPILCRRNGSCAGAEFPKSVGAQIEDQYSAKLDRFDLVVALIW